MNVHLERLRELLAELDEMNNVSLQDIKWFKNGEQIYVTDEDIQEWRFIGLSNVQFARQHEDLLNEDA